MYMVENLIESRRSSNTTKKQKKRKRGERVYTMVAAHYADIYTFDPEKARWDSERGLWVYYEGYGQKCQEKTDFVDSVNWQHDLWKTYAEPVTATEIIQSLSPVTASTALALGILSRDDPKRVQFVSDVTERVVETYDDNGSEGGYHFDTSCALDGSDRADRGSVNFQQMLADYVEKARSRGDREGFFDVGGMGRKWGENVDFVNYFTRKFEEIDGHLNENKGGKISLSDQGVKDYPLSHYRAVRDRFFLYNWGRINAERGRVSNLRATAPVFVPVGGNIDVPKVVVEAPRLRRTGPPMICGVYKCDLPVVRNTPKGPPPPRRPSASTKNSTLHLTWEQKEEHERDYGDLSNKLDKIATLQ